MLMFTKSTFGEVKIGTQFFMYDLFMIKIDVNLAVAIGHVDHIGFHLDYNDDLMSRGLTPFNIQHNVEVSIAHFGNTDVDHGDIKTCNHLDSIPNDSNEDFIFVIDGEPYIKVDSEGSFHTLFKIDEIYNIENGADYGVMDSPNTKFVRGEKVLVQYVSLIKE